MKKNWRTNLGGAISITGSALVMAGLLPQLSGTHSNILWWATFAGFFLSAIGKGVTALFAADSARVKEIVVQTEVNTAAIETKENKSNETK